MRKKYIDGTNRKFCEQTSSRVMHIDGRFNGYISLVKIEKVKQKVIVEFENTTICLFNDGYKSVVFLPDNENWCIEAIYDNEENIVEWYFDMTKLNSIDENHKPFFDDLYLDIVVMPDDKVIIFDKDELQDALNDENISKEDYELAYKTAKMLKEKYIPNKKFMIDFFNKYLAMFVEE